MSIAMLYAMMTTTGNKEVGRMNTGKIVKRYTSGWGIAEHDGRYYLLTCDKWAKMGKRWEYFECPTSDKGHATIEDAQKAIINHERAMADAQRNLAGWNGKNGYY